ncbi:MAG TPA: S46 family peptidase [Longimicrobiales bacterium]
MTSTRVRALLLALLSSAVVVALPIAAGAQVAAPARARTQAPAPRPAGYVPEFGTMWTFDAAPLDYWKTKYNFTPDQAWLDHVRLASVRLPGCSSSFVSANGLVMTNHHCARSCISDNSTAEKDYQQLGFVAATLEDERKCPGNYVDQLQSIEDVTARVRARTVGATEAARVAARDAEINAIQTECGKATGLNCQVVPFYQGGKYSLYRYRRFSDVRLVMAPEEAISFFGGDPDNFTYPRYDLDLTLFRVYEDGKPYQPKDYLKWSPAGAKEGDLVFVVGNPGSTGRLLTMAQMEYLRDVQYPATLANFKRQLGVLKTLSARSEEDRRRFENTIFGMENSQKATIGYWAGLKDSTIMARKRAFERDFRARINADPKLRAEYGTAWDAIATAEAELKAIAPRMQVYNLGGSTMLQMAAALVRAPTQAALPEAQRIPGYAGLSPRDRNQILNARVDPQQERLLLTTWLTAAQQGLDAKDPVLVALLAGRTPEQAAQDWITKSTLADPQVRRALLEGGAPAVAASTDPLIQLVRKLEPAQLAPLAARAARASTVISANAEKIGQAIFAAYGTALPPDATFTLRISDGVVKEYPYNGTRAPYKTSFYGLYARSAEFDNQPPFQLPQRWLDHRNALDLSTPLDFVSTNDIIGGNSGSPVVDRNGQVVGLIFDGNIEQLPNRFIFTDEVARSVAVHSRAIPEALRKVFEAPRLADELEGKSQNP